MRTNVISWLSVAAVLTLVLTVLPACSVSGPGSSGVCQAEELQSDKPRVTAPHVPEADLAALVAGNNRFAFDLYQTVRKGDSNLFYSPYSISLALAMTYAGARGETEQQMAQALHFTLPQSRLHPAFNALDQTLASRGQGQDEDKFQLNIANAIWGQKGYSFLADFLDVLAENYGAGLRLLDFASSPDDARRVINDWVSDQTEGKIEDLLPPGSIKALTRLVLTNAIYFNAAWLHPFEEELTRDGTFYLLDGSQITVPMMEQTEFLGYAEGEGYQVVELPYKSGELSMVILLPQAERFAEFARGLDAERVDAIVKGISQENVRLTMPKFTYESSFSLKKALMDLGMPDAFTDAADFSGMDGTRDLFISDVLHKAFVSVDEAGTEAAAATAVIMGLKAVPGMPHEVTLDHPFIFLIRDIKTGAILFLGQVINPAV